MPNVDQPRRLVVTILVSLLVGCTPSENIRSAERMPETHEQVPSGLIALHSTAKVPMRYLSCILMARAYDVSLVSCQRCPTLLVGGRAADRVQCRIAHRQRHLPDRHRRFGADKDHQ